MGRVKRQSFGSSGNGDVASVVGGIRPACHTVTQGPGEQWVVPGSRLWIGAVLCVQVAAPGQARCERSAREWRYHVFSRVAAECGYGAVVTAHTSTDRRVQRLRCTTVSCGTGWQWVRGWPAGTSSQVQHAPAPNAHSAQCCAC